MVFFCILSLFFSFMPMNELYLYLIFFYTLHTPAYLSHILFVPVKGVKASFFWLNPSDCPFFSLERKEPKVQGLHYGGYGLGRCAKISENSPSAQTTEIF